MTRPRYIEAAGLSRPRQRGCGLSRRRRFGAETRSAETCRAPHRCTSMRRVVHLLTSRKPPTANQGAFTVVMPYVIIWLLVYHGVVRLHPAIHATLKASFLRVERREVTLPATVAAES